LDSSTRHSGLSRSFPFPLFRKAHCPHRQSRPQTCGLVVSVRLSYLRSCLIGPIILRLITFDVSKQGTLYRMNRLRINLVVSRLLPVRQQRRISTLGLSIYKSTPSNVPLPKTTLLELGTISIFAYFTPCHSTQHRLPCLVTLLTLPCSLLLARST
jgi:hypothetical protein